MNARKARMGQNFLTDRGAARRIVEALGDVSHGVVVEIGPGRGALTDLLAEKASRVVAVELDRTLAAQLRAKFSGNSKVEVVEADILKLNLRSVLATAGGKARVLGNLPYYITSDIMLRLFEFPEEIGCMVLMVQREVADRIAARPGTRDYGLLSATCQLYAQVEKLFTLPPGAFTPRPKVHSTVLRMRMAPRFAELGVKPEEFIVFLKLAFGMKRKTLVNNLKKRYGEDRIRAAMTQAGVRLDVRAEAMGLEESAGVFRELTA